MSPLSLRTIGSLSLALCACGGESHTSGIDAGSRVDATIADGAIADAGAHDAERPTDSGGADGGRADSGSREDSGSLRDSGSPLDAGPRCEGSTAGRCDSAGVSCLCCPAGGPLEHCLCTTSCRSDGECTDPARPRCNAPAVGPGTGEGICTSLDFICAWGSVCASPDTPIATPAGERPIAELREGDLVYSVSHGEMAVVPIASIHTTAVVDHAVVRVTLATGRVLEISGGHPTADGRTFADLAPGQALDGATIVEVQSVPYEHPFTYDILPASDTGTYVAGGVLIASTLGPR